MAVRGAVAGDLRFRVQLTCDQVRTPVVKEMLQQFAMMLAQVVAGHPNVSLVNGQGLLTPQPASWDNELHPKGAGFDKHAQLFRSTLQAAFPGRVF